MTDDTYTALSAVASAVAALGAMVTAGLAWWATRQTGDIAHADLLLRLDEQIRSFQDVHIKLRPGGSWAAGTNGPTDVKEWARVEAYMGVFERVNFLVDRKLIKIDVVDRFYGYRYDNIDANPVIYQAKLEKERGSWTDFIALGQKLDRSRKQRGPHGAEAVEEGSVA